MPVDELVDDQVHSMLLLEEQSTPRDGGSCRSNFSVDSGFNDELNDCRRRAKKINEHDDESDSEVFV